MITRTWSFFLACIFTASVSFAQSKESGHLIIFDIPLVPVQKTLSTDRIVKGDINIGSLISPWEENVKYRFAPIPEFVFLTRHINFNLNGMNESGNNHGTERKVRYIYSSLEVSAWYLMAGFEGFTQNEDVPRAIKGLEFNADFSRESGGSTGWVGVKFGDFSRSFISLKGGSGFIRTKGDKTYGYPLLGPPETLLMYEEEFRTKSLSVEARFRQRRLSEGFRMEGNYYKRVVDSPDAYRFGKNDFGDGFVQAVFEVTPLLKYDFARFVVKGSKRFGVLDSLLFKNDPAEVQVYLRIAFK